jgi:hypothetical protein
MVRLALDVIGSVEELFEEGPRELLALDHVPQAASDRHEKSSFPTSLGSDLKEPRRVAPSCEVYQLPLVRMNKRPGQVVVTTEVGFCSVCGRPRTLRHEEHQLGTLVRTIVTCETCHRTLSSTIGVATAQPVEPAPEPIAAAPAPAAPAPAAPAAKPKAPRKPAAKAAKRSTPKTATSKTRTHKKNPK